MYACICMIVLYYSVNVYICTELKNLITFWRWYSTYFFDLSPQFVYIWKWNIFGKIFIYTFYNIWWWIMSR